MEQRQRKFETSVAPHLDAAFNLARWLTGNDQDARDVVQDACVRAYRSLDRLRGTDARPWLLAIVRNSAYTWIRVNRPADVVSAGDGGSDAYAEFAEDPAKDPEALALENLDRKVLNEAIAALPTTFREVLILRELEELSYREIANITDAPIGTVMSRLSRARRLLAESFRVVLIHAEVGGRR